MEALAQESCVPNRPRVFVGDLGSLPADFAQRLEQQGFAVTGIAKTAQLINAVRARTEAGVVLLFAPCINHVVLRVVAQLVSEPGTPVAVFCEDAGREAIQSAVSAGVSAYAASASRVQTTINLALANHSCTSELKEELDEAKQAFRERGIVERAKLIVMARRDLNEADAYKLLRTRAMQRGMGLVEVARALADAAELVN
jgi:response regulator NasT